MRTLFQIIQQEFQKENDLVLASIVASSGSTPRGAGSRMLVGKKGRVAGTIGGGSVEYRAELMALDILEKKESDSPKYIVVKNSSGVHKLLLSNIVCVEAFNRKVIYYLNNDSQLECSERFTSICDKLMYNHEFLLAHRSFVVNMNFIRSIGATDMQLQNGKTIPLAQRRVSELKKQYLAFQMEETP